MIDKESVPPFPTLDDIEHAAADYDWEAVVELVTEALEEDSQLSPIVEYELLRARARALHNVSTVQAFLLDIQRMVKIARSSADDYRTAQALNMLAFNRNLAADWEAARAAANEALQIAQEISNSQLLARALNQLGWNLALRDDPKSEEYFRGALALAEKGISPKDEVWALWLLGWGSNYNIFGAMDSLKGSEYLSRALSVAREHGDRLGEALILRALSQASDDIALQETYLRQALRVATTTNDKGMTSVLNNNFAWRYWWLGLYKQAITYGERAVVQMRDSGLLMAIFGSMSTLAYAYLGAGDWQRAQRTFFELVELDPQRRSLHLHAEATAGRGRLFIAQGRYAEGIDLLNEAVSGLSTEHSLALKVHTIGWLSAAHLELNEPEEALAASDRAVEAVARHTVRSGEWPIQDVWWWRYKALNTLQDATGDRDPWSALEQARLVLFEPIVNMGDEGLRRNYLNKPPINRAISETWAREAVRRGLSLAPFADREISPAGLAQQLQSIVNSGERLAGERDTGRLADLIVQEFVELSGVERAILAIRPGGNRDVALRWAATEGIDNAGMGSADGFSAPFIERAILTRAPMLVDSAGEIPPDELRELHLRSALALPLVSQGRLWGVLYGDMRHLFGRLNENDRDILSLLANQAGAALENANWVDTLEQQVTERTAEAEAARAEAEAARSAAERANQTKSAFMSNMSHELRTPLNAIIGFTRIVQRKTSGQIDAKQSDNLDKVLSSSEHLLGLINTVLDIAKIEAGRMDVNYSTFPIQPLVHSCVALTHPLLRADAQLVAEIEPDLPAITSDHDKLKQILLNLLSNAAKFTHEGKIVVSCELRVAGTESSLTTRHSQLITRVKDTGIGMSAGALERIFEEFQQADSSTSREYGGTGLGLPISKHLAQLLGGDLTAASTLGQGSTFTLVLPILPQE